LLVKTRQIFGEISTPNTQVEARLRGKEKGKSEIEKGRMI
jgi:hypothetical protein